MRFTPSLRYEPHSNLYSVPSLRLFLLDQMKALTNSSTKRKHVKIVYEDSPIKKEGENKRSITSASEWPSEERIRAVHAALVEKYGNMQQKEITTCGTDGTEKRLSILESLISVILSQNTNDNNSSRAFASLRKRFPNLDDMRRARVEDIEDAIRSGGLAKTKSKRIHQLLSDVYEKYKTTSLQHLENKPNEEIKEALSKFHGVGPKSISCVLLFNLHRADFPVDTHVHRVTSRLGWAPTRAKRVANREQVYEHLNKIVPDELKYELHCLVIEHGRKTCHSRKPNCAKCPLQSVCDFFQSDRQKQEEMDTDIKNQEGIEPQSADDRDKSINDEDEEEFASGTGKETHAPPKRRRSKNRTWRNSSQQQQS